MRTTYVAAERIALTLPIEPSDTLDALLDRWRAEYRTRTRVDVAEDDEQVAAARALLEQRLELTNPPPLPPSSSSNAWRCLPALTLGLPQDERP